MKKIVFFLFFIVSLIGYGATNIENLKEYVIKKSEYDGKNIFNQIEYYSTEYKVPIELVIAVIEVESEFNPCAVSKSGAIGLMQLMPDTAKTLRVNINSIDENIKGGVMFLKECLEKNNNDIGLALATYNAGYGNIKKFDSIPPFPETQEYIQKVVRIYNSLSEKKYIFNNIIFTTDEIKFQQEDLF